MFFSWMIYKKREVEEAQKEETSFGGYQKYEVTCDSVSSLLSLSLPLSLFPFY